ncbi:MAG TPA: Apocarotenoid-15,15'-oxygenase [Cyanothece sp. UBA12306]|nr:Apocarotenoid-15,15'-oxygenase [Cyanothece sp. UBA12306]
MTSLTSKENQQQYYSREQWLRGYQSQPNEYDYWVDDIEGEIPRQLQGTLFRNGPGLLEVQGTPLKHPFDGDGMVCAISFLGDGRVHFRNRFVRSEGYMKEQEAQKMLYRGVFGTQKPGGWFSNVFDLKIKNISNTNVIYWGDKLLSLWEAAQPYQLDPKTLETIKLDDLNGAIGPKGSISAHPWIDPYCQLDNGEPCLVNFSIKPGLSSKITVYEFNPEGKLLRSHSHVIPGFSFIHDFAITPNYCIFLQNSVKFNPLPYILGLKGAGNCVEFQPDQPSKLVIIPRIPPYDQIKIIKTKTGFVFHHSNAFEVGEKIYLDSICYKSLPEIKPDESYLEVNFKQVDPSQLWRFTIDLDKDTIESEKLSDRPCEFPTIHPAKVGRNYRYLYLAASHHPINNSPVQAIYKFDQKTRQEQVYSFAPFGYVGEPIFVPKPNGNEEDDGWLLLMVYYGNIHRSDVVILDAKDLSQSPLAKVHLKHHIPYGLHGSWTSQTFH